LADRLDDAIEIPEVLHFTCNDRTQLLDQLKVLQMVLRKERDKDRGNFLPVTDNSSSKIQFQLAPASDTERDFKEKIEKRKKIMEQQRQDKLKQMDSEAQALFDAINKEETNSSKDINVSKKNIYTNLKSLKNVMYIYIYIYILSQIRKRNQDSSTSGTSVTKKVKMHTENSDHVHGNKQNTSDSQSSSTSSKRDKSSSATGTSIMDMYQTCDSEKSRREVRQKAIQMMRRSGYRVSVVEPGEFAVKYALSAPYHLFFTRIEKSKETYNQQFSITFPEILDRSLGEITNSLHLNFMVDVGWLCLQYLLAGQRTDMMIFYGDREDQEKLGCNITMIHVDMPSRYGCHHSKIMILQYKDDGIRVVVSSANLYSDDWENRTQGSVEYF